jgi:hypothetical protein
MKKFNPAWVLAIWVPLLFIIGACVFLSSEHSYGSYSVTGWEVLQMEGTSFWFWVITLGIVGLVCLFLLWVNVTGKTALGRTKLFGGSEGTSWVLAVLTLVFLMVPWAKGLTDASNGGVTAPHYEHSQISSDTTLGYQRDTTVPVE